MSEVNKKDELNIKEESIHVKNEEKNKPILTIKRSSSEQVAKISLLILESMGIPKELAEVALDNISDKENVDEALEWIKNFKMNIDFDTNINYLDDAE